MEIVIGNPPIYNAIIGAGLRPSATTIYTYGDKIYNPNNIFIPDHLMVHEAEHSRQQGADPDYWWGRYLSEPYFRLAEEIKAYHAQYVFACHKHKDRNTRVRFLWQLASSLSGPMYGNIISQITAERMIKNRYEYAKL